jgi:hypothetical protein
MSGELDQGIVDQSLMLLKAPFTLAMQYAQTGYGAIVA